MLDDVSDVGVAAVAAAATAAADMVVVAVDESLPTSNKSSFDKLFSIGCTNEIKSVSLAFVRFKFRGVFDGGGANEPLLADVGNGDFPLLPLPNVDDDDDDPVAPELPKEPGRGR